MRRDEYETFKDHSTWGLMDLAETFHTQLAGVNGSIPVSSSQPPMPSTLVASAGPDGLRLNFGSSAVIGMVLAEMSDVEAVIDEGWRRIPETARPGKYASLLVDLEAEARKCLDVQFVKPACGLKDLALMARTIGRRFGSLRL